jgi:prepilin-type N-terminal cleavage/methylation domain-containing protein
MQIKNKEFDRTFFKTRKSRSIKFALNESKGFTLIELLVVISIIALLSTIILGFVQDGRVKARNTAKNDLVLEYVKALEMYRSNNVSYPSAGTGIEIIPKCIGYLQSENCHSVFVGSDTINNIFSVYMANNFSQKDSLIMNIGGTDREMRGITYKCNSSNCTTYKLTWYLKDTNSTCIDKAASTLFPNPSTGPNRLCTYTLN